jgi:hypothetical protein
VVKRGWFGRRLGVGAAVAVSLAVVAVALGVALPGRAAQSAARPTSVSVKVPQRLLDGLRLMDIELNDLIRKIDNETIGAEDVASGIRSLVKRKHALLVYFPSAFGVPFASVYDNLSCVLESLIQAQVELASAEKEGRPFDKKSVLKLVRLAERWKVKLEASLERATSQKGSGLKELLKALNVLDIDLLELDLDISKGKLTAKEIDNRLLSLGVKTEFLLGHFPGVFSVPFADVFHDLYHVDSLLQIASRFTNTTRELKSAAGDLEYASKWKEDLEKELRKAGCGEQRYVRTAWPGVACPPPPPPPPPFVLPNSPRQAVGTFTNGQGGCPGLPTSFTDNFLIGTPQPGQLVIQQPSTGDVDTGPINPDGSFHVQRADGQESYDGTITGDTATATNHYTTQGCTETYQVTFTLQ